MTEKPGFFYAQVSKSIPLSESLIRIVFAGGDLHRYVSNDVGDESVGVYFPRLGEAQPPPMTLRDGYWAYHHLADAPEGRNYTVRALTAAGTPDAAMTIDFVVHDGGIASAWARSASPGDRVLVTSPRSWYRPSLVSRHQILLADLTGLPAMARIAETRAPGARVHLLAEVAHPSDLEILPLGPGVTAESSVGTGNGLGPSVLARMLGSFLDAADPGFTGSHGYVWCAAEASETRAVRKYLRRERLWSVHQFDVLGYWRLDAERWRERFEPVAPRAMAAYSAALREGADERMASEVYDETLERAGL